MTYCYSFSKEIAFENAVNLIICHPKEDKVITFNISCFNIELLIAADDFDRHYSLGEFQKMETLVLVKYFKENM